MLAVSSFTLYMDNAGKVINGVTKTFNQSSSAFQDVFQRAEFFSFSEESGKTRTSFRCFYSGRPSDDVTSESEFTELFTTELEQGFEVDNDTGNSNFVDLQLQPGERITILEISGTS